MKTKLEIADFTAVLIQQKGQKAYALHVYDDGEKLKTPANFIETARFLNEKFMLDNIDNKYIMYHEGREKAKKAYIKVRIDGKIIVPIASDSYQVISHVITEYLSEKDLQDIFDTHPDDEFYILLYNGKKKE